VERLLGRLARGVSQRRRLVVGAWVALLVGSAWFSLHQSDHLSGGGWEIPGSPSVRASAFVDRFPGFVSPAYSVLVTGRSADVVTRRLGRVAREVSADPQLDPGPARRFEAGRAALLPVAYTGPVGGSIDAATRMRHELVQTAPALQTRVIGQPAIWSNFQEVSKEQLAKGEAVGFPLILLILLAGFGTLVAAVAPLALGFVAVFLTGAVIYWLSRSVEMSVYVTNMASMIGIGVAVDYSLFVVSRFRRELHRGAPTEVALERSLSSSGTAVVFSGATVAVSLAGLYVIDANAIRSMALGAIVVVVVSVLAAVTLLPALLALVGANVERASVPLPWRTGEEGDPRFWRRWTERVMARPVVALAAGTAFMLLLASPLLAMRTLNRGLEQLPPNAEVRTATERAQALAGPGFAGPVHVLVGDRAQAERLERRLSSVPGVARVDRVLTSEDGRTFLVNATLDTDPESDAARATYHRIVAAAPGALVGGSTAFGLDVEHEIFGGLWKMLLFILAVSYVVLLVLLRSVLLPLKAVAMNLLSIGAAYGVLVALFQWGWLDWTGYRSPGHLDTIVPALVLAVTFGLSMDYEVFLLTRIRERYARHGDNAAAVSEGLVASARIITSAALVMVAVFAAFALFGAPSLRELGVGLAVAIGLDASVVRLVIVPATMRLLGDWNWWLPRPLARILPPASAPTH
jgi:uncharacterized membrane protein YdfJ with MMPL/SSD domain